MKKLVGLSQNFIVSKKYQNILKFILFLGVGGVLLWLVYRDQDWNELWSKMQGIKWIWFIPALAVAMLSHVFRAVRWNLLLKSMGNYKPRLNNTFFAVMVMYFVNLAIPRLGEVTRSGIVSRYDKLPFSKVLGTMVTERATDMIMLILVALIALFTEGDNIAEFIRANPEFKDNVSFLFSPYFWIAFIALAALGLYFMYTLAKGRFDKYKILRKTGDFIRNFMEGIKAVFRLDKTWLYIFHSVLIFAGYYFMLYLCFPAFEGLEDVSMLAVLTVFAAGSFGMVAPAPNGMGAWHFMTIQSLIIFGVLEADAKVFALVVHSLQMVMLVVVGIIAVIGLPIINRDRI